MSDQPPAIAGFLDEAVRLATVNGAAGQPPFGALIVRDGRVISRGVNTTVRDNDPTAHAEVAAIRAAWRGPHDLAGAVLISSCQPCPMCLGLAVLVEIERIVYAATREEAAAAGFALPPDGLRLQDAWRDVDPARVEHHPVPGAGAPFAARHPD